jgi:predicted AAA+ superfamily ATPase
VSRKVVEDVFRVFMNSSKLICVLLGRAGFGKTVYLRHLHQENNSISLFFDGSEVSEIEILLNGNMNLEEQHSDVKIIFIDAINEGNAGRFVGMILSNLAKLRERELRIVMTCRTEWWKALGRCGRVCSVTNSLHQSLPFYSYSL